MDHSRKLLAALRAPSPSPPRQTHLKQRHPPPLLHLLRRRRRRRTPHPALPPRAPVQPQRSGRASPFHPPSPPPAHAPSGWFTFKELRATDPSLRQPPLRRGGGGQGGLPLPAPTRPAPPAGRRRLAASPASRRCTPPGALPLPPPLSPVEGTCA
jgi:hypothetical protein